MMTPRGRCISSAPKYQASVGKRTQRLAEQLPAWAPGGEGARGSAAGFDFVDFGGFVTVTLASG
jgi:hypothetical protein